MEDFLKLAKDRYSCRRYSGKKVEKEKTEKLLKAALLAPTAVNWQRQRIQVIESEEGLKRIAQCSSNTFGAPEVLLVSFEKKPENANAAHFDKDFLRKLGLIDVGIVSAHIALAAKDLGLDTCIVMTLDTQKAAEMFDIPDTQEVVMIIDVGYAAENAHPSAMHDASISVEEMAKEA